jgi:hypothetical protein
VTPSATYKEQRELTPAPRSRQASAMSSSSLLVHLSLAFVAVAGLSLQDSQSCKYFILRNIQRVCYLNLIVSSEVKHIDLYVITSD